MTRTAPDDIFLPSGEMPHGHPRLDDHRRVDQRLGAVDEEALRRRRHPWTSGTGPQPGRKRRRLHRRQRRLSPARVHGRPGPQASRAVTAKPLSIDTPDPAITEAGLEAYDLEPAGGKRPILNSISPLRLQMFDLCTIRPFRPILLVVGERGRRPSSAMPYDRRGDPGDGPHAWSRRFPPRVPGVTNDDCHHRPGHRPDRQRFGGQHPPRADRRWS